MVSIVFVNLSVITFLGRYSKSGFFLAIQKYLMELFIKIIKGVFHKLNSQEEVVKNFDFLSTIIRSKMSTKGGKWSKIATNL